MQSPMLPVAKRGGRRWSVALYRNPEGPRFWQPSRSWGGRYDAEDRLSPGIGFQAGAAGWAVGVIVWPRSVVLFGGEAAALQRGRGSERAWRGA